MPSLLVVMLLAGAAPAATEPEEERETVADEIRTFVVRYADGETERYQARYLATLARSHEQVGHSARIPGKGTSTASCDWTVEARVVRELFLVNRAGHRFRMEDPRARRTISPQAGGEGGVAAWEGGGSGCHRAEAAFRAASREAGEALRSQLAGILARDAEEVGRTLAGILSEGSPVPVAHVAPGP